MKKTFLILTLIMLFLSSCKKYDHAIADIEENLKKIEGTTITTIDQQIAAINSSIDDLKAIDSELNGYIEALQNTAADLQSQIDNTNTALAALEKDLEGQISASEQKVLNELNAVKTALEGQLATINNTIATLQAKDAELDQKIADLKTYVDNELVNYATKDWANATFTTLEQYEEMQTVISEINALIKSTQESIAALEEKLNKKIADDIAAAVTGVNSYIAAKVTEITNGYTTAITDAANAITEAYTNAIKTAITDCENAMREWVNGVLADGYYQKAEIDGKITALQTQVAEGDAALQKEIDDLKAALEKASSDLNAAYEEAIADAVADGGIINAAIAAAVQTAQDNLQAQIDTIKGVISEIESRLANVESQIAALIDQIQSLTYIPTYTDGKATMAYNTTSGKWEAELSFFVTPKSVVGNIKLEHLSAKGVYTAIRAVDLIDLPVTAFESDDINGTITVSVSGDNLTDFLGGTSDAAVFLILSDGNSEFVSDYVPLALKNPGNINAANMSADDLKTTVSQALNDGVRNFTITSNLTEDQQKAVGTALRDWCGYDDNTGVYNEEGQGTVTLILPDVTEVYSDTFGEILVDGMIPIHSYALGALYLPNATKIGKKAFFFQIFLREVHAPKVATVDGDAFEDCDQLTTVEMPYLETVGAYAFSLTLISTIPGNPVTIGNRAFDFCSNLTKVNLTKTTSIGMGAFRKCNNLQSVTAPLLTEVPTWAFADCGQLTSLTFAKPITQWKGQVLNNVDTENITLTLHPDQKVLTGGSNNTTDRPWTPADGAATVEFGTGKTFCGYIFKEIKKYGE